MRSWARRLLPVIALAVILVLILTGVFRVPKSLTPLAGPQPGQQPSQQALAGQPGGTAGGAPGATAGTSNSVGAIPGGPAGSASPGAVAGRPLATAATLVVAPLRQLRQADLLILGPGSALTGLLSQITTLTGVVAAVPADAARLRVNGVFINVLGVDPSQFRPFAAGPTARSTALWQNVAAGGIAISYTMSQQDRLSLSKPVQVYGTKAVTLPVAGFGTVGIGGVDAVVSHQVAAGLGIAPGNAIVVSAPQARLAPLMTSIKALLPANATVAALVSQVTVGSTVITVGSAGGLGLTGQQGPGLTALQTATFLAAARSRIGLPYVWGGSGPNVFDCSGLVQWSMKQAGLVMPRVAADQARTGPLIPLSGLQPGDLLFYHTDPTAPSYISHVAIYIGNGQMLQAPRTGLNVEITPAFFGAGYAGAVRVYPSVAVAVAAHPLG